jgi:hypothetical protein
VKHIGAQRKGSLRRTALLSLLALALFFCAGNAIGVGTPAVYAEKDPPLSAVSDEDSASPSDSGLIAGDAAEVAAIEIGDYKSRIAIGESVDLAVEILPAEASGQMVSYSSGDPAIASVSAKGQVKGVSKGETVIFVKSGTVATQATITVIGAKTAAIDLNTSYLVLSPGETFHLKASVIPSDALQELRFKSLAPNIASVDGGGRLKAVAVGSASILVSNEDMVAAVTLIVSKNSAAGERMDANAGKGETSPETGNDGEAEETATLIAIRDAGGKTLSLPQGACPVVTRTMLRALVESQTELAVEAEGYTLTLKGSDIANIGNELDTLVQFEPHKNGIAFSLNGGQSLPGKASLILKGAEGRLTNLYLLNSATNRYERLTAKDGATLYLDTAGDYLLTDKALGGLGISKALIFGGGATLVIGIAVFVFVRKRYLFW